MARKNKKHAPKNNRKSEQKPENEKQTLTGPWISMRSGIRIITLTSIVMAVLTAWEAIPAKGVFQGILWGLLFGVLIWVIFFGFIWFNRLLKR